MCAPFSMAAPRSAPTSIVSLLQLAEYIVTHKSAFPNQEGETEDEKDELPLGTTKSTEAVMAVKPTDVMAVEDEGVMANHVMGQKDNSKAVVVPKQSLLQDAITTFFDYVWIVLSWGAFTKTELKHKPAGTHGADENNVASEIEALTPEWLIQQLGKVFDELRAMNQVRSRTRVRVRFSHATRDPIDIDGSTTGHTRRHHVCQALSISRASLSTKQLSPSLWCYRATTLRPTSRARSSR